jgi:hypothetical protein
VPEEIVPFGELATADLVLDRVYQGGKLGHAGDDAIGKLVPVGNQGGFRFNGSVTKGTVRLVVLYTSGAEVDWPDHIEPTTGDFTYYGDNRKPGKQLAVGMNCFARSSLRREAVCRSATPFHQSCFSNECRVVMSGFGGSLHPAPRA